MTWWAQAVIAFGCGGWVFPVLIGYGLYRLLAPRRTTPTVDWRRVADLEREVYGQVVSEQAKDAEVMTSKGPVPVRAIPTYAGTTVVPPLRVPIERRPRGPWKVAHRLPYIPTDYDG